MPGQNLNLLCLDGGGVRGLSSLYILQRIMMSVDHYNPPKPCDYFDMIGGTSTGGLIAIMLGRLQMDIDDCIAAYIDLSNEVFQRKRRVPANIKGDLKERFDSEALELAFKKVIKSRGFGEEELFQDPKGTKVFVCCTSGETSATSLLRSYHTPRGSPNLLRTVRIWEAARATSAASTFFDSINIGSNQQRFLDGGSGANNPIRHLWGEATDFVGPESLLNNLNCLISIGTGQPSYKAFNDTILGLTQSLLSIATESEATARLFRRDHSELFERNTCFRFNVPRGMGDIGLAEVAQKAAIESMTDDYLGDEQTQNAIKCCVQTLKQQQRQLTQEQRLLLLEQSVMDEEEQVRVMSANAEWQLIASESEIHDILRTISSYQPRRGHDKLKMQKLDRTGTWILDQSDFIPWVSGTGPRCLWLSGIVGCGKTFVANTVVQALLGDPDEANTPMIVLYFYFDPSKRDNLRAEDMFRSYLKQLLLLLGLEHKSRRQVKRDVKRFFNPKAEPPNNDELVTLLLIPLLRCRRNIVIVADGLDVCPPNESFKALESFRKIQSESSAKLFISGREELRVVDRILGTKRIWTTSETNHDDMLRYIEDEVSRHMRKMRITENVKVVEDIENALITGANGMFLWVRLQVEMLWATCKSDAQIAEALGKLPQTLEETYDRCLQRLQNNKTLYSLRILRYVCEARSPLPISALGEALAIDPETGKLSAIDIPVSQTIIDCGANLIILDIDDLVLPAHHSVRQYITPAALQTIQQSELSAWDDVGINLQEICIAHLWWTIFQPQVILKENPSVPLSRLANYVPVTFQSKWTRPLGSILSAPRRSINANTMIPRPPSRIPAPLMGNLYNYAKTNWVNLAQDLREDSLKWGEFKRLVFESGHHWQLHPWYTSGADSSAELTHQEMLGRILGWSIVHSHLPLLRLVIGLSASTSGKQRTSDSALVVQEGLLPLHLASKLGRLEVLELLLPSCDVFALCPITGWTAFHYAAKGNHPEILRALFRKDLLRGEQIILDQHRQARLGDLSIMELAVREGCLKTVIEIEKLFPEIWKEADKRLLKVAISTGHRDIVNHLLGKRVFLDLIDPPDLVEYPEGYEKELIESSRRRGSTRARDPREILPTRIREFEELEEYEVFDYS